ncbi:UvrD-helicase domain-containing protein [Alsobacter sp. R-9]
MLRILGHKPWAAEQTVLGIRFLGGPEAPFSEWAGPARLAKTFGFSTIIVPLDGGSVARFAGLAKDDAARFVSSANAAFRTHILRQFDAVDEELKSLSDALERLEQPRRYPAACLVAPFLARARAITAAFPRTIPKDMLSEERQRRIGNVQRFLSSPEKCRQAAIERFIGFDLTGMQRFFDTIEKNPLTPEQRLAVVTDEDATLVLAGAGSGKTSVIVAKAGYLVERGIRQPHEVLLLAFGKDAASEMATRIRERTGAAVDAMTFHALGMSIFRAVEGRKPALAHHAADDVKLRMLLREILHDEIAAGTEVGTLILSWFSEFVWPYKSEWDFKTQDGYFQWVETHDLRTLNGDLVRSYEEWLIANWLYRNGIAHEYEPLYEGPLPADARGPYRPDFRLTESGIYIEHFGVRKAIQPDGSVRLTTAPFIDRDRYLADMAWKRELHHANGTNLIETFSYEKVEGTLFEKLAEKLAPYVTRNPVPDDLVFRTLAEMGQVDAFTQTLGTFLKHFKGSGATIARCEERAASTDDVPRSLAFLKIFKAVINAYEARLDGTIDFEDMIIRAAAHVETGRYRSPYRHLLVDEFQDISEGRARLLLALKSQHDDARLFAVGDDWQSIYRFSGADIRLMRSFGAVFGGRFGDQEAVHSVVDLGRTFRSVDKIAGPARHFVLRNPAQIPKTVVPAATTANPAIRVAYVERGQDDDAVRMALEGLSTGTVRGTSVLLLGRYNHVRPSSLEGLAGQFPRFSIRFMTMHASKGLEADHVVILRAVGGRMGFPSEIVDDPVLDVVLPEPESFEHAEERRLFYVALTRARTSVTILADRERPSTFVRELTGSPDYEVMEVGEAGHAPRRCRACGGRMLQQPATNGRSFFACEHRHLCGHRLKACSACGVGLPERDAANPDRMTCSCGAEFPACPVCADGWLLERKGRHGRFLGCVSYPTCRGTQRLPHQDGSENTGRPFRSRRS